MGVFAENDGFFPLPPPCLGEKTGFPGQPQPCAGEKSGFLAQPWPCPGETTVESACHGCARVKKADFSPSHGRVRAKRRSNRPATAVCG